MRLTCPCVKMQSRRRHNSPKERKAPVQVANKEPVKDGQTPQQQQQFFLQFCTTRQTPGGEVRMRVTTLTRAWTDGSNTQHITAGFDQECAAVVLARLATHKMEFEEEFDAMRW